MGLHFHDLYSKVHVKSQIILIQQLCLVMGVAFLTQGLIAYVNSNLRVPIRVMVVGSAIAVVAIFFWRVLFSTFVLQVVGRDRLLLVGGSPLLEDIGQYITEHPESGLEIAGYLDDRHQPGTPLPGGKTLGPMDSLRDIVRTTQPNRIVVGMFERRNRMPVSELLELRFGGNVIEEAANTYERVCGRVCLKEIRPSQLIFSGELGPRPQNLLYQRISNVVVAVIGIIAFVAHHAAHRARRTRLLPGSGALPPDARRPRWRAVHGLQIPFHARRCRGRHRRRMGPARTIRASPPSAASSARIRFDELPQLFNVFRGEMSMVGPRPERPEFVKALNEQIPYYRQRHCVRPGITGWAQINYKYGDTLEDTITKLEYDLYYIKNMSHGARHLHHLPHPQGHAVVARRAIKHTNYNGPPLSWRTHRYRPKWKSSNGSSWFRSTASFSWTTTITPTIT